MSHNLEACILAWWQCRAFGLKTLLFMVFGFRVWGIGFVFFFPGVGFVGPSFFVYGIGLKV